MSRDHPVSRKFREIPGNSGPGRSYSVLRENSDFLEISLRAPCQFQRCCSVLRQNLGSDTKSQKATPCSRVSGNWPRIPREFGEVHSRNYSVLFLTSNAASALGQSLSCRHRCAVRKSRQIAGLSFRLTCGPISSPATFSVSHRQIAFMMWN